MELRLPTWVRHEDGRRTPFDPEGLSQALFAASEAIGAGNAFLARELSEGVLHFLAQEDLGDTASAAQVLDVAAKVIRELGQPALAKLFTEHWQVSPPAAEAEPTQPTLAVAFSPRESPAQVSRRAIEEYALRVVFGPDLAAAHRERLLTLGGLDAPERLSGVVLDLNRPATDRDVEPGFETGWRLGTQGRDLAGRDWLLDGPDQHPWHGELGSVLRGLAEVARDQTRIWAHLHAAEAPSWAQQRSVGPLFAGADSSEHRAVYGTSAWLDTLQGIPSILPVWHWWGDAESNRSYLEWARHQGPRGGIVFDRPRRGVSLGLGMDRVRPASLLEVHLHLPELLRRPEVGERGEALLEKLPNLVRMAVGAGVRKRKFLRDRAEHLGRGFLLDRAVLRLVPWGLDAVVRRLLGVGVVDSKLAQGLGRQILTTLHESLPAAHRSTGLDVVLAAPPEPISLSSAEPSGLLLAWAEIVRGLGDATLTLFAPAPGAMGDEWSNVLDRLLRQSDLTAISWASASDSR